MKKSVLILLVCLIFAACGSSGGGDSGDVGSVTEGSGPSLDVSKTSDVATYVNAVVTGSGNSFDTADNDNLAQSSSSSSIKSTTSSSEAMQKICKGETYSKDINIELTSGGGSAAFTGLIEGAKEGSGLVASLNLDGTFNKYGLSGGVYLTGSANKKGDMVFTEGLDYFCSEDEKSATEPVLTGSLSEEYSGEFSISGKIGAAVTYNYTVTADITSESESGLDNVAVEGTASFKSNDKTVTCTIGRSKASDTDIDNYQVTCSAK